MKRLVLLSLLSGCEGPRDCAEGCDVFVRIDDTSTLAPGYSVFMISSELQDREIHISSVNKPLNHVKHQVTFVKVQCDTSAWQEWESNPESCGPDPEATYSALVRSQMGLPISSLPVTGWLTVPSFPLDDVPEIVHAGDWRRPEDMPQWLNEPLVIDDIGLYNREAHRNIGYTYFRYCRYPVNEASAFDYPRNSGCLHEDLPSEDNNWEGTAWEGYEDR
jgi:hypothetical protein